MALPFSKRSLKTWQSAKEISVIILVDLVEIFDGPPKMFEANIDVRIKFSRKISYSSYYKISDGSMTDLVRVLTLLKHFLSDPDDFFQSIKQFFFVNFIRLSTKFLVVFSWRSPQTHSSTYSWHVSWKTFMALYVWHSWWISVHIFGDFSIHSTNSSLYSS